MFYLVRWHRHHVICDIELKLHQTLKYCERHSYIYHVIQSQGYSKDGLGNYNGDQGGFSDVL